MTAEELSKKYNIGLSTITTRFANAQKSIKKKYNVDIIKVGRGAKADYVEKNINDDDDKRAITIFEEVKEDLFISNESLQLINWNFLVFLAITITPMRVFRGSYEDFLRYVEVKSSASNLMSLKAALRYLQSRELINYTIDKTNSDYFVANFYRKVEEDMKLNLEMVKKCKQIAQDNNKQDWVPLLKTWIGYQIMEENQPFTMKELEACTGLSEKKIRDSRKLLEKENLFKTNREYAAYNVCIGSNVTMNGIYN